MAEFPALHHHEGQSQTERRGELEYETLTGENPGTFIFIIINNCCFGMIAANEGPDWIRRPVEYQDTHIRFLDSADNEVPLPS